MQAAVSRSFHGAADVSAHCSVAPSGQPVQAAGQSFPRRASSPVHGVLDTSQSSSLCPDSLLETDASAVWGCPCCASWGCSMGRSMSSGLKSIFTRSSACTLSCKDKPLLLREAFGPGTQHCSGATSSVASELISFPTGPVLWQSRLRWCAKRSQEPGSFPIVPPPWSPSTSREEGQAG